MQERHTNKQLYFNEQAFTTEKFVIPFISKNFGVSAQINVLEIGCGEGGNLKPFLDLGCSVTGIDLAESKIKVAIKSFEDHANSAKARFIARDIYLAEGDINDTFDLIIMRDVIEHIHNQELFMGYVMRFLKPGGVFFLAFPPWYNPFGGHQQVADSKILSKLPYFHLFPKNIYRFILKAGGETQEKIDGFLEIKDTGISIERFRKILKQHGYHIITETMFFINPNYNIKFGLKPRKQISVFTAIPFFRNFVVTACYYLIKLKD